MPAYRCTVCGYQYLKYEWKPPGKYPLPELCPKCEEEAYWMTEEKYLQHQAASAGAQPSPKPSPTTSSAAKPKAPAATPVSAIVPPPPAPSPVTSSAAKPPATTPVAAQRKQNRWGDGIDAPAAGARDFFPVGFVPQRELAESMMLFGHSDQEVAGIISEGRRKATIMNTIGYPMAVNFAAAIYAFTLETPNFYTSLNDVCRTPGLTAERRLEMFRDYLRYMDRAFSAVPTKYVGKAYRGIKALLPKDLYAKGKRITWQPFTSTTKKPSCTLDFIGWNGNQLTGSFFVLNLSLGADISMLSAMPHEQEVLLGLNTAFKVVDVLTTEAQKKAEVPELEPYDLAHLHVYVLEEI